MSGRFESPRSVAFQIYESDLESVQIGDHFSGYSSSSLGEIINGKIAHVDNLVDSSSRTVRVIGTLEKNVRKFTLEGAFHGNIASIIKDKLAIPEEAVLHTGKKDLVYLLKENKFTPHEVTLGNKAGFEYPVLSGLNENDIISSGPNFLLDSESKIRGEL